MRAVLICAGSWPLRRRAGSYCRTFMALGVSTSPVWASDAAVAVVSAARGYPESPRVGEVSAGGGDAAAGAGVDILHAGTRVQDDGSIAASGGRVLSVTAVGDTLHQARDRAYTAVDLISLAGSHPRRDTPSAAAHQASHPSPACRHGGTRPTEPSGRDEAKRAPRGVSSPVPPGA